MSDTLREGEDQMSSQRKQLEYEASEVFDYGTRQRARERLAALDTKEDQMGEHQVNRSGVCGIPGCPCRGWSAQESAKEVNLQEQWCECNHSLYNHGEDDFSSQDCRVNGCDCDNFTLAAATHQPAARGGGEWHADTGYNYGYVWQGGALLATCVEPSRADQIVTEHNQYQTLVAEREPYTQLLKAAKFLLAMNDTNYDRDVMRSEGGFDALQKAVDAAEQRSTSE